jgi:hypothetical protein
MQKMNLTETQIHDLYIKSVKMFLEKSFKGDMSVSDIFELLKDMLIEKILREEITDSKIDYNDEIVSIECVGELDTVDISVSGDNLFCCNGILTKNSIGLIMSLDSAFTLIATDELSEMDQIIIKMLKNRYGELDKFVVGLEKAKMKFYELEASAQTLAKPALAPQPSNAPQRLGRAAAEKFSGFKM